MTAPSTLPAWRALDVKPLIQALALPPSPAPLLDIRAMAVFCALHARGYTEVRLLCYRVDLCRTSLGVLDSILLLSGGRGSCNVHGETISEVLDGRYGPNPQEFTATKGATHPKPNGWHRGLLAKNPDVVALVDAAFDRLELDQASLPVAPLRSSHRL